MDNDQYIKRLQKDTEQFWRELGKNPKNQKSLFRDKYIPDLLPREMALAILPDEGKVKACRNLVLLVGPFIEPLLQSILAYKPERVLLSMNRQHGDTSSDKQAAIGKHLIVELPGRKIDVDCCQLEE